MRRDKNIITPPSIANAFGKKGTPNSEKTAMQMVAPIEFNYEKHIEYNESINEHDTIIGNLVFRDNHVLLRYFKFEKDSKTEGGIITEDIEYMKTDGGQIKGRINQIPFQKRAVVVKSGKFTQSSKFLDSLTPGTIVHLAGNNYAEFHIDKTKKVDVGHGYILLHSAGIEAIESL